MFMASPRSNMPGLETGAGARKNLVCCPPSPEPLEMDLECDLYKSVMPTSPKGHSVPGTSGAILSFMYCFMSEGIFPECLPEFESASAGASGR